MTKEELAQKKDKDSDYTCEEINHTEYISENGLGCCLQIDKKLETNNFLSSENQKYDELIERIEKLEKETAELKATLEVDYWFKRVIVKDNQLTKAKKIIEKLSKSLFLAKGIIRDLIDDTVDFKESYKRAEYCFNQKSFDSYKEAEQFLKEISE